MSITDLILGALICLLWPVIFAVVLIPFEIIGNGIAIIWGLLSSDENRNYRRDRNLKREKTNQSNKEKNIDQNSSANSSADSIDEQYEKYKVSHKSQKGDKSKKGNLKDHEQTNNFFKNNNLEDIFGGFVLILGGVFIVGLFLSSVTYSTQEPSQNESVKDKQSTRTFDIDETEAQTGKLDSKISSENQSKTDEKDLPDTKIAFKKEPLQVGDEFRIVQRSRQQGSLTTNGENNSLGIGFELDGNVEILDVDNNQKVTKIRIRINKYHKVKKEMDTGKLSGVESPTTGEEFIIQSGAGNTLKYLSLLGNPISVKKKEHLQHLYEKKSDLQINKKNDWRII